ncbi:MAG: ATP-binding cassette domain-containing protein, partial [Chroococcidiopsidaceae cyanobacterium CP_BM_RX_35]|nr:ATP-binding cassette domain-containing protein [Chroococcidiopsidaceae cyanobacterium CP_BM_RX_35]
RQREQVVVPAATQNLLSSVTKTPLTNDNSSDRHAQGVNILRRINLTVEDGEFMVLVGPSGCGKSTLLRLIAGLEEMTGGNIWVGDRLVNELPPKARDIAMVFQNYALYPHMSVYNNLAFGLRRTRREQGRQHEVRAEETSARNFGYRGKQRAQGELGSQPRTGVSPPAPNPHRVGTPSSPEGTSVVPSGNKGARMSPFSQWGENLLVGITRPLPKGLRYITEQERAIDQRVRHVAALLQIEPLLERRPKHLSGGQKQRVALGRAIARNPQVFLMDEPLSNLDAKLRAETRAQIVKLQRQLGTTTVYVTHDQTEAMTMGDRIAVMCAGQLQQVAHPLELYNRPATQFVAEFIGSPPMNFLQVQFHAPLLITHSHFRLTLPAIWADALQKYDGQSLILGIRPEHLSLSVAAPKNLPIKVDLVEALGNETYLFVRPIESATATTALQARIPPERVVRVGEQLWLSLTPDKIHFFHPETGLAIWSE